MKAFCEDCGVEFNRSQTGTWVSIEGYAEIRSAGGANAIRERRETGRYICPSCAKLRDLGVLRGQGSLL